MESRNTMIIDSHAHIGKILDLDMPKDILIESMKKYKIDFSLVSSVEAAEYDGDCKPINPLLQKDQVYLNNDLIKYVMDNKKSLGALIWCKPHNELINEDFESLIENNNDIIYGLKFHPFHSQLAFNDELMEPYFKLARKHNLPIVTHTANSYESSPKLVYEISRNRFCNGPYGFSDR
jgi:predicted TIM-barrel fold metal-dependent hydrolase